MRQGSKRHTHPRLTARLALAATSLLVLSCLAPAEAAAPYAGRSLDDVLRELSGRGLQLIYNVELVPPQLRVGQEPQPGPDVAILDQVLAEHGLQAQVVGDGIFAIVRKAVAVPPPAGKPAALPSLEAIVVTASRYSLATDVPDAHQFLTQTEVAAMPRFADDALKAVHRLPGAASNGLSGLAHMRGGEENETEVIFDGLPLIQPFHLRLIQSPTSVLDERVVDSMDVYTGGFTAEYGDRMGSVVDIRSVHPAADQHYELGISNFHFNGLAAQRFDDGQGQWLAANQKGTLFTTSGGTANILVKEKLFDIAAKVERINLFASPTIVLRMVRHAEETGADARNLKTVVVGGAPFYVEDARAAVARLGPVVAQIHAFCRAGLATPQPASERWRRAYRRLRDFRGWRAWAPGRVGAPPARGPVSTSGAHVAFVTRDNHFHRDDIELQYRPIRND